MCKPSTYLVVTYFPTYIWDLFPTELVTKVKPNVNSVEVHLQLSTYGHPVDGALVGACSLQLTGFISIVQLGFNCRQCHDDGKMHVPSIKCVVSPGLWTSQSGVNRMQWPDFPHNGICIHICICMCKCVFWKTLMWPVSLAQVVPCPQLIFPSKTWFFWIFLNF